MLVIFSLLSISVSMYASISSQMKQQRQDRPVRKTPQDAWLGLQSVQTRKQTSRQTQGNSKVLPYLALPCSFLLLTSRISYNSEASQRDDAAEFSNFGTEDACVVDGQNGRQWNDEIWGEVDE